MFNIYIIKSTFYAYFVMARRLLCECVQKICSKMGVLSANSKKIGAQQNTL